MASEVNAIVEDLRWLHLELTLRNRCNEVLFQESATIDSLLESAFGNLRAKLGVLELSVFLKGTASFIVGFRDQDANVHWLRDHTPWVDALNRWFEFRLQDSSPPSPIVNHYTVGADPITVIAMPVLLEREYAAALLIVVQTSNIVPRLKKLLAGLSGSVSLVIDYIRNRREASGTLASAQRGKPTVNVPPVRHGEGNGHPESRDLESLMTLRLAGLPAAFVIDSDARLLEVNERLEEEAGILRGWAVGKPLADLFVPEREQEQLRHWLTHWPSEISQSGQSFVFPIKCGNGKLKRYTWSVMPLSDKDRGRRWLCSGIPSPDGPQVHPAAEEQQVVVTESKESRLSKQYRFMMKYVPFPVFLLDGASDVIRNANRAFESIVGVSRWEGLPLGDFGTLHVHASAGDIRPCDFHVLSPNGITLTYHGIVTPLMLYGKEVREVKLDPLDITAEGDAHENSHR